jgi:hypothetical protein
MALIPKQDFSSLRYAAAGRKTTFVIGLGEEVLSAAIKQRRWSQNFGIKE